MKIRPARLSFSVLLYIAVTSLVAADLPSNGKSPSSATNSASLSMLSDLGLVWDADLMMTNVTASATNAHFVFNFTNVSQRASVILDVESSCDCTTVEMPKLPWVVPPGSNGQIAVTVELSGGGGAIYRLVSVLTDKGTKNIAVEISQPKSDIAHARRRLQPTQVFAVPLSEAKRQKNLQEAKVDRQAVFRNDCATCHGKPSEGKYGRQLYDTACGICHESKRRADIVPSLHAIPHQTGLSWQEVIANGKPSTLMPAFSKNSGGPLTEMQIASLASYLDGAMRPDISGSR